MTAKVRLLLHRAIVIVLEPNDQCRPPLWVVVDLGQRGAGIRGMERADMLPAVPPQLEHDEWGAPHPKAAAAGPSGQNRGFFATQSPRWEWLFLRHSSHSHPRWRRFLWVEIGPITLLDFGPLADPKRKHTEGFERLLPDPKGTPVADGTDLAGIGPALNRWRDGGDFSCAG